MRGVHDRAALERPVRIAMGNVSLDGDLTVPEEPHGVVLFAHGSGSSRHSTRNRRVAGALNESGLATLLMDLLTADEEGIDARTAELRFDIGLLSERLIRTVDWLAVMSDKSDLSHMPVGLFGASTGAAAALVATAERPNLVKAVVSRGGRPDLANGYLNRVQASTLLIVGGSDYPVIPLNEQALARIPATDKQLAIVPGATHLFEEPGTLDEVSRLASSWFGRYLVGEAQ